MGWGGVELDDDFALDFLGFVGVDVVGVAGGFAFFGADGFLGL